MQILINVKFEKANFIAFLYYIMDIGLMHELNVKN